MGIQMQKINIRPIFASITLAMFLLSAAFAFAQGEASVFYVKGAPKIMKSGSSEWQDCKLGMRIDSGDHVKTVKEEALEISFLKDRSNMVRIEEDSDVFIKKNEAPYSIELISGAIIALIKKLPAKSSFEIRTPIATCGSMGTGWRTSTDGSKARFEAFERRIYVKGIEQSGNPMEGELIVNSGWASRLNKFERPEKLERLSYDDIDRWNRWKKDMTTRVKNEGGSFLDQSSAQTENRMDRIQEIQSDIKEARDMNRMESQQESRQSGERDTKIYYQGER
jgi:hypothetical protein